MPGEFDNGSDFLEPNTQGEQEGSDLSDNQSEATNWETDSRFEKMWSGDPNKLFESYRNMEKMYEPTKAELESLRSKYEELNKSQLEVKPVYDYLSGAYENQKTRSILEGAINQINQELKRAKYGDLPDEHIERMMVGEKAYAELQEMKRQQEEVKRQEEETNAYFNTLSSISDFAKENGIAWGKNEQSEFIKFAQEKGVKSTDQLEAMFYKYAIPAIKKSSTFNAEAATLNSIKKSASASIPAPASRNYSPSQASGKVPSFKDLWNQKQK